MAVLTACALVLSIAAAADCAEFWKQLLDRADSLISVGEPDSADAVANLAMSNGLKHYARSDTTLGVAFSGDQGPEIYYFGSYEEAESLCGRVLTVKRTVLPSYDLGLAKALTDLGEIHLQQRKYSSAHQLLEEALSITERNAGAGYSEIGRSLSSLADACAGLGLADTAEALYGRSIDVFEGASDSAHPDLARSLNGLAALNWSQTRYAEAEPLYKRALKIREEALGPDHPGVAQTLNNLGLLYSSQGNYVEAEPLYRRALEIRDKTLGPNHPDIALSFNNLANLYLRQGRYDEAEPLYKRAIAVREKVLGTDHQDVAITLSNLALLYNRQGRYAEVEPLYRRALGILETAADADARYLGGITNNLAILYRDQGRYDEAEPLFKRALDIKIRALGHDNPSVARTLENLGVIYNDQGRYGEAEPLYRRAIEINERSLGEGHPAVALNLNNLATLCADQGRYGEAELLLRRALGITEEVFPPGHPATAQTLNNLAIQYRAQGKYGEAESLYVRASDIIEETLGPDHPRMAQIQSNLANVYRDQGRYDEAESLYTRAVVTAEGALGPDHPDVAMVLYNLAVLQRDEGNYHEAETSFKRALNIRERSLGPDRPDVARVLNDLGSLYRGQGRLHEAGQLAQRAYTIRHRDFATNALVLSEKDALTYSAFLRACADGYLSCYLDSEGTDLAGSTTVADVVLSRKGRVSDEMFERRRAIVQEKDSTTLAIAESLAVTKFQLSRLFVEGPGENLSVYKAETDSLAELVNRIEAELSRQSASYRKYRSFKEISTQGVASVLPKNAALIEYVNYDYQQLLPEKKVGRYLAVVFTGGTDPSVVDLGEASSIDTLVRAYRNHMLRISTTERLPLRVEEQEYITIARRLYDAVILPIEGWLSGTDLVFIAPDGGLNLISFGALIDQEGAYFIDKNAIHYVSAGRDLARLQYETALGTGLLAIGDPDYDRAGGIRLAEAGPSQETATDTYFTRNVRSGCGELHRFTVEPLPHTRREIEEAAVQWRKHSREPATVYLGQQATEDNFKAHGPGKRVIHLATHGYFLESRCNVRERGPGSDIEGGFVGENPLLLSGLFLAGANLHGKLADSLGHDDGILTAYEVSAMDLGGTDLVILSACETGLGEVTQGEGVYGLRRAFQMAGARTVVSALWPVSDEATARMMSGLYDRQDESIPETMRRIQLDRLVELRREGRSSHPFTWAGFVAVGDWR